MVVKLTFMSRGIIYVNNVGQDDGVGGRDSGDDKRLTGSDLLSFAKDLGSMFQLDHGPLLLRGRLSKRHCEAYAIRRRHPGVR